MKKEHALSEVSGRTAYLPSPTPSYLAAWVCRNLCKGRAGARKSRGSEVAAGPGEAALGPRQQQGPQRQQRAPHSENLPGASVPAAARAGQTDTGKLTTDTVWAQLCRLPSPSFWSSWPVRSGTADRDVRAARPCQLPSLLQGRVPQILLPHSLKDSREKRVFYLLSTLDVQNKAFGDFPGGPVVRTPCFHCCGHGFDPWSGN